MAATQAELGKWFDIHKERGYDYMLVYVDEFGWEDYPVGVYARDYWPKRNELHRRGMQRYDLHADRDEQFRVARVDRFLVEQPLHSPPKPTRVKTTKGEPTMNLSELYRKNGLDPGEDQGLSKLFSIFDERLDAFEGRAESIEKQLEPRYKASILNSPQMRDGVMKRVLDYLGIEKTKGMPPTPAQTSSGDPAPRGTAPLLTFQVSHVYRSHGRRKAGQDRRAS